MQTCPVCGGCLPPILTKSGVGQGTGGPAASLMSTEPLCEWTRLDWLELRGEEERPAASRAPRGMS